MIEEKLCTKIAKGFRRILGQNLCGIYLHGSMAFGCYLREKSDLDFLVVVEKEPDLTKKCAIIRFLFTLEKDAPKKGLEMSMVLKSICKSFVYPTPFILHYSPAHTEAYQKNLRSYCASMRGTDKDLAAHFAVTRQQGIALLGVHPKALFQEIPRQDYLDSIWNDLKGAVQDVEFQPASVLLNLCRGILAVEKGQIVSKIQGGIWGIKHLSVQERCLIEKALLEYQTGKRQTFDLPFCKEFCLKMQKRILIGLSETSDI